MPTLHVDEDGKQGIPLSSFPASTAAKLRGLSASNGLVALDDLEDAAEALQQSRTTNRMLLQGLVALLVFMGVLVAALGGTTWYIVQASKELSITDHVLTSAADHQPVRVASADVSVVDNTLVAADEECAGGGECWAVRVGVEESAGALSSLLPDEALQNLRSVTLHAPAALLHLAVTAFARYPDAESEGGSAVVLHTRLGELYLHGSALLVGPDAAQPLLRAGFQLEPADAQRRRLLGVESRGVRGRFRPAMLVKELVAKLDEAVEACNCSDAATDTDDEGEGEGEVEGEGEAAEECGGGLEAVVAGVWEMQRAAAAAAAAGEAESGLGVRGRLAARRMLAALAAVATRSDDPATDATDATEWREVTLEAEEAPGGEASAALLLSAAELMHSAAHTQDSTPTQSTATTVTEPAPVIESVDEEWIAASLSALASLAVALESGDLASVSASVSGVARAVDPAASAADAARRDIAAAARTLAALAAALPPSAPAADGCAVAALQRAMAAGEWGNVSLPARAAAARHVSEAAAAWAGGDEEGGLAGLAGAQAGLMAEADGETFWREQATCPTALPDMQVSGEWTEARCEEGGGCVAVEAGECETRGCSHVLVRVRVTHTLPGRTLVQEVTLSEQHPQDFGKVGDDVAFNPLATAGLQGAAVEVDGREFGHTFAS